ncbi:ABC transporter substrate-binding protein [Thermobispora bispora]|mgnify:CR=1 FL=1|uniref:Extracellular solute-binding protein family 1 n=1 Tax=Thermobispora bispora (strain ATCC 19993 / DSM 43833 / CBS 139.67 / JCM 10125 / KCTC 9307 / NBRC 14880 / R51) TaxID=469371 RepID=D6Y6J4_THEBD|nr:extracellular solute-binding protein [Thermobispora bispora]ADG87566.1 extracellular solute-binding protein family 1 [Thermobispora bispora DSM 43833]MBO2472905.1 ABC transporter substrate-binding protein [Actinomycetales bacterium]MBX6167144.1 extracellular solute-binding protein [Thermobispora bispora]MDI9582131.1 extracellular solute-binding protein [Thermobispora sp.]
MGTRHVGRRIGRLAAPMLAATLIATAAACGGDGSTQTGSGGQEKIKLTVGLFGDFGFEPLYEEFKKTHPNIEIEERQASFADHHTNLAAHLATGAGAADVEAIEVGYISQFTAQPDKFHDLREYGLDKRQGEYLPWKWQQGVAPNGALIGLGTDVGGLAMCYRTDLFEKAGLPTDRDEVSALWPTWEDFIETGKKFMKSAPKGTAFIDSPGEILRAIIAQAPVGVYDQNDNIVVATNPDVKRAWDLSVQMIQAGLSAKIAAFTPEWNTGFSKGTFATVVCPAWMTAYIQDQAKNAAGKWDIAAIPGGAGNSGGSHLTVPKQSKHPKEAAELVDFLTSAESQAKVFKTTGNFPSIPSLYDQPDIQNFTKDFFNGAPVGKIYSEAAKKLQPQHLGPREGDVRTAIGNGLGRVEQGKQTPEEAWAQVLKDVEKIK